MTVLAGRINRLKDSPTLAIAAKAARYRSEGRDVISLSLGEPDFDTPEHIKRAAETAMRSGHTKYTAVGGTVSLRKAIVHKLRTQNGLEYALDEIVVSCGAKHSFFNLVLALLEEGDEVVIPAPYWPTYVDASTFAGARPIIAETGQATKHKLTPQILEAALSERTRLVVINSPSNPSGALYSAEELSGLGAVLRRYPRTLVLSDDIYEHILLTASPFINLLNVCPDLRGRFVTMNGISKCYAMTGWRIGYVAGPADVVKAMETVQSHTTSNPSSISQAAAEAALLGDQTCATEMAREFSRRGLYLWQTLNEIPGVKCMRSEGAFYSFPNCEGAISTLYERGAIPHPNDTDFAEYLLEQANVAVVPGTAFGGANHVRISFASSMQVLEEAMNRLKRALI